MKNLKKVLSLALAFAMVLGLCIGASAAQDVTTLTDWNEVENKDAATLLNAFNIMQGNDDGTFAPNDNVTRAQAAKMISVALWGGSDDVALYNASNIGGYTDVVAGSWYMGYVNYMTATTVMTGKGDGVFDPNGNVTGYELLKMCLIALGYNPETEGLVGAGWDVKTMSLATRPGFQNLTADTTVTNWNAPLSRMNAATIISNMIQRTTVYYDLNTGVGGTVTSQVKPTVSSGEEVPFAESYLKMTSETGVLVANEYGSVIAIGDEDTNDEAPIDTEARNYKDENTYVTFGTDTIALKLTSTYEQLGSKVKAYYKDDRFIYAAVIDATEIEPTFKASELTNVDLIDIKNEAGEVTQRNVRNVDYILNGVLDDEAGTEDDNPSTTDVNEAKTHFQNSTDGVGSFVPNTRGTVFAVNPNAEIKYLDTNGNGYIDLVVATVFNPAEVKTVSSVATSEKYGTVYMTGTVAWNEKSYEANTTEATRNSVQRTAVLADNADFEAEKGDKFIVAPSTNVFGDTTYHGYVLEMIEGAVTRKATNGSTIYIDGVKYGNIEPAYENGQIVDGEVKNSQLKSEGKFYVRNDTIFFSTTAEAASSDTYALIYDAGFESTSSTAIGGTSSLTIQVAAILPDGTSKVFTVKDVYQNVANDEPTPIEDKSTLIDTDTQGKPAFEEGFLADVKNVIGQDGETSKNRLCAYTLNNDGTINLFLPVATGEITEVANDTKVTTGVSKVTVANTDKYLTADSITYIQSKAPSATAAEQWVVYKGTSAPSYDLTAAGEAVLGTAFGTENLGIKYMAATSTTAGGNKASGVFCIVSAIEEVDGKYVATIFSSDTGKTQEIEYTATVANKGERDVLYSEFNTNGGFDPAKKIPVTAAANATHAGTAGYITSFGEGTIAYTMLVTANSAAAGQDSNAVVCTKPLMVDKDTKYYSIAGADSKTITAADVATQQSVADIAAGAASAQKQYQAVFVEGTGTRAGYADAVIILAAPATATTTVTVGGGR